MGALALPLLDERPIEIIAMNRDWSSLADDGDDITPTYEQVRGWQELCRQTGNGIAARWNALASEIEAGALERSANRALTHAAFDDIRDRKCAEMWGCTVCELPWRQA